MWSHKRGDKARRMKQRPISMEGLNEHESRWRLLVFGVPHIHWRRIQVFGSFLIRICFLFWFGYEFPITWKVYFHVYAQTYTVMPRFSKYVKTESWRESVTYIREKNTPRIYAQPKVTWTSNIITMINQYHCNVTYKHPHMITYEKKMEQAGVWCIESWKQ